MDQQTIINLSAGIAVAIFGWFARVIWEAVVELRKDIHDIEVTLPSHYVRKDEFSDALKVIFDKLDRIADKIDEKADKRAD